MVPVSDGVSADDRVRTLHMGQASLESSRQASVRLLGSRPYRTAAALARDTDLGCQAGENQAHCRRNQFPSGSVKCFHPLQAIHSPLTIGFTTIASGVEPDDAAD